MPGKESFFNFLQLGVADKVYGGAMDPVEGASWRSGEGMVDKFKRPMASLNLKDYVLESGGKSREAYASGLGIEEAVIDTVKYDDVLNYEFIVGSKENPNMKTAKGSGTSTGNPNVSSWSNVVDDYASSFLKRDADPDDMFGGAFDERADKYKDYMKMLTDKINTKGGMEEMWADPFWSGAYDKYAKEFGSK